MGCTRISHALCYGIRVPFVTISHLPHPRGKVHPARCWNDMGQFMGKKALSGSIERLVLAWAKHDVVAGCISRSTQRLG